MRLPARRCAWPRASWPSRAPLKQREDGKWAVNYEVADATGLTVGAPLDRTYMFSTLGVSYITINDTVIIDIEAEAAAAK